MKVTIYPIFPTRVSVAGMLPFGVVLGNKFVPDERHAVSHHAVDRCHDHHEAIAVAALACVRAVDFADRNGKSAAMLIVVEQYGIAFARTGACRNDRTRGSLPITSQALEGRSFHDG